MTLRPEPYRLSEVIALLQAALAEHGDIPCETPIDGRGDGPVDGPVEFYSGAVPCVVLDLDWARSGSTFYAGTNK